MDGDEYKHKYEILVSHLARRTEFERVIFSATDYLARRGREAVDMHFQAVLGELNAIMLARRILLLYHEKDNVNPVHVVEWCPEDVPVVAGVLKSLPGDASVWLVEKLKGADVLLFEDLLHDESVPVEVRSFMKGTGMEKMLVFPIFISVEYEGFLVFQDPENIIAWSQDDHQFFQAILQVLGLAIDRVFTEEDLKRSEEKARDVLQSIKEAYFELDKDARLTFFNYALCTVSGHATTELANRSLPSLFMDHEHDKVASFLSSVGRRASGIATISADLKRKDGKRCVVEVTVYRKNDEGDDGLFFGFLRDVTEQVKLNELMQQFARQLEAEVKTRTKELDETLKTQKLYLDQLLKSSQFKSDFMATMSHELRTPLNAIIGFTELLRERLYGELNPDQAEYIEHIHSSAEMLLEMINRILDISKIEAGKLKLISELVSINDIVSSVLVALKPLYEKKDIELITKGLTHDVYVYGDPIRLKEIVMNLMSNAIKYTPSGTITLSCTESVEDLVISIEDTGIGIPSEEHHRIFTEFLRIDNALSQSTQGTGLGLSLTKRLVQLHGGNIWFTSVPGEGSTFSFSLPRNLGPGFDQHARREPNGASNGKHI